MRFHKALLFYSSNFGIKTAIKLVFVPRMRSFFKKPSGYTDRLVDWFFNLFARNCLIYQKENTQSSDRETIETSNIIWTLWWQGKEDMPYIIQKCHQSLRKNSNGREIRLLDKDNYNNYFELPKQIEEKLKKKKISFTHLSDIIRLIVITKYGGLWVDAAIFVTHPIVASGQFYSVNITKNASPDYPFGRWVIGVMGCGKNYQPLCFVRDCLIDYWKRYNAAVDYLMFDHIMLLAYMKLSEFKEDVDALSPSLGNIHGSRYLFNKEADPQRFKELVNNNDFLSLTWRFPYNEFTDDGKETYWGMLLNKYDK